MNSNLKTILLTVLTLSCLTIALVELSGISTKAFVNKFKGEERVSANVHNEQEEAAHNSAANSKPKTTIKFDKETHDFGTIKDGDVVNHVYKFTNTGSNPLFIDEVVATCGCTIPSYPKAPVAPGAKGEISISFNSKGRAGNVDKFIQLKSNAQQEAIPLNFKAVVKE